MTKGPSAEYRVPSSFKKQVGLVLVVLSLSLGSAVFAHATIVLGTLATEPVAPVAGEPFELSLAMTDPTGFPIEDAVVVAEFEKNGAEPVSVPLPETERRGVYAASVTLPEPGDYTVTLRDQTFRQEEARVSLTVALGDGPMFLEGENSVVFPPTATASASSLSRWLIWVIALPVVAGIVVTVLVLRSPPQEEPQS